MQSRILLLGLVTVLLAACGSVAEDQRATFEPTNTALARAANAEPVEEDDAEADVDTAADAEEAAVEPTAVPPTVTPIPPTATPEPTAEPTEEATEAPAEEAAAEAAPIVVNGVEYIGEAEVGEFWFNGGVSVNYQNVEWQCMTCHNVAEPVPGSGPYLHGLANRLPYDDYDGTVSEYLVESILNANAYISPAQVGDDGTEFVWAADVMPTNWGTVLDDQTVADLVAYLLTLDQE